MGGGGNSLRRRLPSGSKYYRAKEVTIFFNKWFGGCCSSDLWGYFKAACRQMQQCGDDDSKVPWEEVPDAVVNQIMRETCWRQLKKLNLYARVHSRMLKAIGNMSEEIQRRPILHVGEREAFS